MRQKEYLLTLEEKKRIDSLVEHIESKLSKRKLERTITSEVLFDYLYYIYKQNEISIEYEMGLIFKDSFIEFISSYMKKKISNTVIEDYIYEINTDC